ncbi:cytochrome P450 [Streptomyces sp. NPDC005805]|uniref:cytochrome P450 n=1 Tax=Streptomyces sp. NPDC005805 TaxID=3157068 RepID=UPI0033C810AA
MLNSDAPDHTRLRKAVVKYFTAGRIDQLKPTVQEIVSSLVDPMIDRGGGDVMADVAMPLPVQVIGHILGVPNAEKHGFTERTRLIVAPAPSERHLVPLAWREIGEYLSRVIAQKRSSPGDDLLSSLVSQGKGTAEAMTDPELLSTAFLLLIAGHETTTSAIGNATFMLLKNPKVLRQLRTQPSLIKHAVEEFLRYDGPLKLASWRFARERMHLCGARIEKGDTVLIALGAANRDPCRYRDPDLFRLERKPKGHLTFGHGTHACFGASLARLEMETAIRSLIVEPSIEMALATDEVAWRPGILTRSLTSLPVTMSTDAQGSEDNARS